MMRIVYILLFFIALAFAWIYVDPDFGWRITLGARILAHGIPATDPYSYTMPSFPFVDHEWLTHIGLALLYSATGYAGLALLFSILYIATVWLISKRFDASWRFAYTLLIAMVLLHHFGVKPQVISWFMAAVLVTMMSSKRWAWQWQFLAPFFFMLWANLHGGFIFGIGIYAIKIVSDLLTQKKKDVVGIVCFVGSVAATLANPYGIRLWEEILRTGSDARLRIQILEWTPQFLYFNLSSFILVAWYLTIFLKYFRRAGMYEKIAMIATFIFGFSSSRNFPLWVVAATPIVAGLFLHFLKDAGKNKITRQRFRKLYIGFAVFTVGIAIFELVFLYREVTGYSLKARYPEKAVAHLKTHPAKGNMLSIYEWGGYLIWNYPEKKVFIDGRMPSWRQSASAHPSESADALGEFMEFISQTKPMKPMLIKYHIDTILLPHAFFKTKPTKKSNEAIAKFKQELKKNGFEPVYSDNLSILYR